MLVHWNCRAMTWTAAEVWCSSWEGSTGSARAGTYAPKWRSFFHKEKARHFQRQHCAYETPTMFQEESAISFKFSLSVCTSQSKTLFFHDSARDFVLLSSHEKQTKKPIKPRAFFPPPTFLQIPYTNLPCRNYQQFQQISHCPSVAVHSRI